MHSSRPLRRSMVVLGLLGFASLAMKPLDAEAAHYSGGGITYECLGANSYRITLDLFLDCAGTAITPQSLSFTNSCGVNFTLNNLPMVLMEEVSQLCPTSQANSTCNGGPLPGIMHYQFQTTLFLAPCNFWTISWSICCRNTLQNVVGTPGMYLDATLNNAGGFCDESPVFAENTIPFVCVNQPVLYNAGASDGDGHTMSFALVSAQFAAPAPTNVLYAPTFSAAVPVPGATIDPVSGQLNFTPTVTGNYVFVIEVSTYDINGNLIGTVIRDFMVVVQNCGDTPPTTTGLSNVVGGGFITSSNTIDVCDGIPFCVDMVFEDIDPAGVLTIASQATAQLPGSTFTVTGSNPATATLCWTPDPAFSPVNILLTATDNACPVSNVVSSSIFITVVQPPPIPPDPGTSVAIATCPSGPGVALFPLLGGTPDAGGTWTAPDGSVHSGTFLPAADAFGIYTYSVGNGCVNASATVTLSSTGGANAGTNGSLAFCSNGAAVALLTGLGGTPQAGGAWTGPSPVVGGQYNPATMAPGVYTYTVAGVAPCPNATATVTVTENPAPNAGVSGALSFCSTSAAAALSTGLTGSPQAGGTWSGPSPVVGGQYAPATMVPGIYTYTVIGAAPCANASSTVTVTENAPVTAGTNGLLSVCSSSAPVALVNSLGGTPQAGGAWTGPSPVVGGQYNPATMAPGVYTYTVTGSAPCANSTATVTVTENPAANAGANGSLSVCSDGASIALISSLGGTPQAGGSWSGPSPVVGGNYDPASMVPGVYTYTVTGVAPCTDASATVTVTENAATNAGINGSVTVCSDGASIALISSLGGTPQAGGTWSGPSPVVGGNYDPATMVPGVYTYTVTGVAPCTDASATVTVTENAATNAGTDGSITVCDSGAPIVLINSLGGTPQAGGTWSGPSPVVGDNYDPATMVAGVYTYTVTGVAPCTNATAAVTVSLTSSPDAGVDGSVTVCSNGAAVDLFAQLGGTPDAGGTWNGPSPIVGGTYDPVTMTAGVYTYSIAAAAPCVSASSTVTVTENAATNAGTDGSITVCDSGAPIALISSLGGTPQAGGTWSGPSPVVGGTFDPATMVAGVYTYTVTGVAPCADATATVTVSLTSSPDAGVDGSVTVCSNGAAVDLFAQLGGTPDAGGTWNGPSPIVGGTYDPATMTAGVYTYSIAGTAPCIGTSAEVVVGLEVPGDPGTSASISLCAGGTSTSLFDALGGSPEAGGVWTGPSVLVDDGVFDPTSNVAGTYTYSISGVACAAQQATVDVILLAGPDAGEDATVTLCSSSGNVDLTDALGGSPDGTGTWTDGLGNTIPSLFDPAIQGTGTYTYTVAGNADCPDDSAALLITVNTAPQAGVSGAFVLCANSTPVSLFDGLTGTLDAGGVWTDPLGDPHNTVFDPLIDPPGIYTYTVSGQAPCTDATSSVVIVVNPLPDAGSDGQVAFCSSNAPVDLLSSLGGTPQPTGTWTTPGGVAFNGIFDPASATPGVYTYTVSGVAPCVNDQSQLTITINQAANAGLNAAIDLCSQDQPVSLLDVLGGTPQSDGVWTAPDGTTSTGSFDPAIHVPGAYTYTVNAEAPCPVAIAVVQVTVVPPPVADIVALSNGACAPAEVILSSAYNGPGSCLWILGNGQTVSDCGPITMQYDTPGSYDVTLIIDAGNGCGADTLTIADLVNVYAQPTAGFDPLPEQISTLDPVVFFNNTSEGANSFVWEVDGVETSSEQDLRYTFPGQLGNVYTVCLIAASSPNCTDSICRVITVDDGSAVYVPNTFTPNGDANNEFFQPIVRGVDPRYYTFQIFDRWGLMIFSTDDPNAFWDGRSSGGEEHPQDVYVWKLMAKDIHTSARIERMGHVTLLR